MKVLVPVRDQLDKKLCDLVVAADDVQTDIEPLAVAKILAAVAKAEGTELIIAGKQAIDNCCWALSSSRMSLPIRTADLSSPWRPRLRRIRITIARSSTL